MKKSLPYFIFAFITLLIMIPMYRRGFVFLLDMVWPPTIHLADYVSYGYQASFPILAIIRGLSLLIPLDVIQKIVLSLLLFLPGALMYRLAKTVFPNPWATASGVVYMLNPWVYERFLAGHWFVLLGYALFPLVVKLFWQMMRDKKRSDVVKFALAFALYPVASLHWAYIAGLMFGIIFLVYVFGHHRERSVWSAFSLVVGLCLVLNSFWLVSGFFGGGQTFSQISFNDFKAFATLSDPAFGPFFNVLSLYGFWQTAMILPKDLSSHWWMYTIILLVLSAAGMWRMRKERMMLGKIILFAFVPVLLVAVGYAHGVTRPVIGGLYYMLPGFKGLRETEKLVGLIAFAYAVLAPFGMKTIVEGVGSLLSKPLKHTVIAIGALILVLIPFATTTSMLWGFQGRVVPREYPSSWFEAKRLIEDDPESGKVLVVPWHGYMSLSLAQYRVILNPASGFFGKSRTIAGKTIENSYLKETDQGIWDEKVFRMIHGFEPLNDNIEFLRSNGVTHVVLLKESDWREQYGFIANSSSIQPLYNSPEITVYQLR